MERHRLATISFTLLKPNYKLTDINVVFSQSHQREEEDVPVDAPEEEEGLGSSQLISASFPDTCWMDSPLTDGR